MPKSAVTFLMYEGAAEAAIRLYETAFSSLGVTVLERHGAEAGEHEGKLKDGRFRLCGQQFRCYDSTIHHPFGFTPAISLFIECADRQEQDHAYAVLAEGGQVLMPLDDYGFSERFGWVADRYGVSWQLNLE
jgi:predicted 3-demethylubiquinone-9 3-methyltransferase (glyoxalase superfamily)